MTDFTPLDITWLLISAFLVMTMQIGFCMLETGLVRSKNSINVAFKNVMDFVVASLTFWAIGYGLMYGDTISGMLPRLSLAARLPNEPDFQPISSSASRWQPSCTR